MTSSLFSLFQNAAPLEFPLATISASEFYSIYLPAFGLLFALIITLFGMWTVVQNRKMRHETIRIALEKGQPIPAELLEADDSEPATSGKNRRASSHNDLRAALVLFAVAGGLYFIVPFVAPLLGFIGLALLISWFIERRDLNKTEKRDDLTPRT